MLCFVCVYCVELIFNKLLGVWVVVNFGIWVVIIDISEVVDVVVLC